MRPWGTAADNAFLSLDPVPGKNGKSRDLNGEKLKDDSSKPVLIRLHDSGEISDELIREYIRHQDHNIRFVAANKVLGINSGYIGWRSKGGKVRKHLVIEFLEHKDPRVRRAMFSAVSENLKRENRKDVLTKRIFDLAIQAIKSPEESWWVQDAALHVIGAAPTDWVVPHVDSLLTFLGHEDWWLQNAALTALTPVVADERSYQKVLPPVGELIRNNQRSALTLGLMGGLRAKLKTGSPEVHKLAAETLRESFTGYAGVRTAKGGQNISSTYDSHLEFIAASLADVPGGLDVLYDAARQKFPNEILPYKKFFLAADPSRFGPKLKKAIRPIITEELIPEYVGRNRVRLRQLAAAEVQSGFPGGNRDAIDGLAALYQRAGQSSFDWTMFADLRNVNWSYHSFDPIAKERVPFDQLITRYRKVTLPTGMENWYTKDFVPDKAGWKTGPGPFGHYNGKLPTSPVHKCGPGCKGPSCYGGTKINTFWEKEVLLLHGSFKLPPLKSGYRYRIRINDGNHVGSGGGHIIYVNGKELIEAKTCNGRGSGGLPKGAYITREFLDEFQNENVTIAAMTFLRFNDKYKVKPTTKVPQGKFSLHIEQQRIPPMGNDLIRKSASVVPMLTSEWQAAQDPNDRERQDSAIKFRFDGRFEPNARLVGDWTPVGLVKDLDEFDPAKRLNPRSVKFGGISFKLDGQTNETTRIWSGSTLMDLSRYEALKLVVKSIGDVEYLFVEAGGFSSRHKPEWRSPWYVLKKKEK